jgi:hypothetical protein
MLPEFSKLSPVAKRDILFLMATLGINFVQIDLIEDYQITKAALAGYYSIMVSALDRALDFHPAFKFARDRYEHRRELSLARDQNRARALDLDKEIGIFSDIDNATEDAIENDFDLGFERDRIREFAHAFDQGLEGRIAAYLHYYLPCVITGDLAYTFTTDLVLELTHRRDIDSIQTLTELQILFSNINNKAETPAQIRELISRHV